MKLRTKGSSIRLRLSQSEVSTINERKIVRETIHFPGDMTLDYELRVASNDQNIIASFNDNCISIGISEGIIDKWAGTDEISISGKVKISDQEELLILVEKDFQCLSPREEDETDMFPHPETVK